MRKLLLLVAALVTIAVPAHAQQAEVTAAAEARTTTTQPATEAAQPAPSIHVERAEIRERVRVAEDAKVDRQDGPSTQRWWWLVAAVAVGVVIAAVVI